MTRSAHAVRLAEAQLSGLRMTADEFFDLPDDGYRYELVHGVVVMSPSPAVRHQAIVMELTTQLVLCLREHPVGRVLAETDAHFGAVGGEDYVYRPEIDPEQRTFSFYVHDGERFVSVETDGDRFASRVVPGFVLDLVPVRALFA